MKIALVSDSSAGLSQSSAKELGVYIARMPLIIDEEIFEEEIALSRSSFIEKMRSGSQVKTAQPALGQVISLFDELLRFYDHIIFVPISSRLSGTYASAMALSLDYESKLTIVDAKFVSAPLACLLEDIKSLIKLGMPPEEIKTYVEKEAYMWASLVPQDLQYLKRGGRIKPAVAVLASMAKIVPILQVSDGEIDLSDKVRTHKKALKKAIDLVIDKHDIEKYDFMVLNGDAPDSDYQMVVDSLEKRIGKKVLRRDFYPIVLAHTGPGTIGICAIKRIGKEKYNGK